MGEKINLGDVAKDRITGFKGVVICDSKWLHGCRRLTLQPQELKDGKPLDSQTFDEPQLQLVRAAVAAGTGATGGPRPEPTRNILRSILIAFALLGVSAPLYASDSLPELLKKGVKAEEKAAKAQRKELEKRMKKYGIKDADGARVIGISAEYYVIDGRAVPCDSVEFKCQGGKCVMVAKK